MTETQDPDAAPLRVRTRAIFTHVPHPYIAARKNRGPASVAEQLPATGRFGKANKWLAVRISAGVGTMACAYVFAVIALISLPAALSSGSLIIIVGWVAQTFLQLVLLSIIIVGQNISAAASDQRATDTYNDAEAVLHEALQIQAHLQAQDEILQRLITNASASASTSAAG